MASNTIDVGITPGDRVTIGRKHWYWSQLEELARRVEEYRESDLPYDTQLALAAYRGALQAEENVMAELEEGDLPELRNPEYARGHRDGYAQGIVHTRMEIRGKLDKAQKAAEEVRKAAYELHRDAENVSLAAAATVDSLLDLTTDEEARKTEQRRTTAELSSEYSRSPQQLPPTDHGAATVEVTVDFLRRVQSVVSGRPLEMNARRPDDEFERLIAQRVLDGVSNALREAELPREENRE